MNKTKIPKEYERIDKDLENPEIPYKIKPPEIPEIPTKYLKKLAVDSESKENHTSEKSSEELSKMNRK